MYGGCNPWFIAATFAGLIGFQIGDQLEDAISRDMEGSQRMEEWREKNWKDVYGDYIDEDCD